jgi:hypothetical protein
MARSLEVRSVPDAAVKCSWPEAKALPDIMQKQVTLHLPLKCHL